MYYVYIVECSDGTYYCGYTTNTEIRIKSHNSVKGGAKYTRARKPVKLVYSEELKDKSLALKREHEIKKMPRREKEFLIGVTKKSL